LWARTAHSFLHKVQTNNTYIKKIKYSIQYHNIQNNQLDQDRLLTYAYSNLIVCIRVKDISTRVFTLYKRLTEYDIEIKIIDTKLYV